jgi:hypothetical protein
MGIGANEEPEVWQMIQTGDLKYSWEVDERVTEKSSGFRTAMSCGPLAGTSSTANEMVAFNEQPLSYDAQRQSHQLHDRFAQPDDCLYLRFKGQPDE